MKTFSKPSMIMFTKIYLDKTIFHLLWLNLENLKKHSLSLVHVSKYLPKINNRIQTCSENSIIFLKSNYLINCLANANVKDTPIKQIQVVKNIFVATVISYLQSDPFFISQKKHCCCLFRVKAVFEREGKSVTCHGSWEETWEIRSYFKNLWWWKVTLQIKHFDSWSYPPFLGQPPLFLDFPLSKNLRCLHLL